MREPANVFTVPAGVTSVDVHVQGERGGLSGGLGAWQTGTFTVTPGERLYVCVGEGASDGGSTGPAGGGGGGFSSISRNADNSSPLILAAGGGGSGTGVGAGAGGNAATHGGIAGAGSNSTSSIVAGGGGGASAMGDGAGGFSGPSPGTAGSSYRGGTGGSGMLPGSGNGGGGGAGWRSGGGGGGGGNVNDGGGGGGGGLSLCNVDDCAGGTQAASPSVTFTYTAPPTATTTTISATPNRLVSGSDITFTTTVSPIPDGGTVTLTTVGDHIDEACDNMPVGVDGRASCTVPATFSPGLHEIDAAYSGTATFAASQGTVEVRTMYQTQTVPRLAGSGSPAPGQSVTYVADIIPRPLLDLGTVDFTLDGDPLAACQDVAIANGSASCTASAPATVGNHTLGASYGGSEMYDVSSGTGPFAVVAPTLNVSDIALDFGSATVGTPAAAKSVTLTAPGAAVAIEATTISGSSDFTVAGGTCSGAVPAGGSCTVELAFTPSAEGMSSGSLQIATDASGSPRQVLLSGRGAARPVDPRTPDPRTSDPRPSDPRPSDPRPAGPRTPDPRSSDPRTSDPKPVDPGPVGSRPAPVRGASVSGAAAGRVAVQDSGAVSIPLVCPPGDRCRVSGVLSVAAWGRAARTAAAGTTVIARFNGVKLGPKQTKALRLRLPASFVKAAQRRGLRTVRATLTITTVRGDGGRATTRERITLVLPRAAAQPERRPSFTG